MTPEVFEAYAARPVPRYTSYPTAPNFAGDVDAARYRAWLGAMPAGVRGSLYLHIPFCRTMCWYCGCNTTVTRREAPVTRYVAALAREAEMVAEALPQRLRVGHVHFGGGTPTLVRPDEMRGLMTTLRQRFDIADDAEIALEIDPRTLTVAMAEALGETGFTRASIGVQCFDPGVQKAINRVQTLIETVAAVNALRDAGIAAINFDLIYGLPGQTVAACRDTVERALTLRPDRLAVFGYAHVPAMKPHQAKIEAVTLPGPAERAEQAQAIADALIAAGYVAIGLDHFALPGDAMAAAARDGRLRRNFQGYTTDAADVLIGLGASAIGRLPAGHVQNAAAIPDYLKRVGAGRLAAVRGYALSAEDRLRGAIIERIMCDHAVDVGAVCQSQGADAKALLATVPLAPLERDGLIIREGDAVRLTPTAYPLVRSVAAAFDAHLASTEARHAPAV